jgi:adenylylsulfate kinase-like enzyme
MGLLDQEDDDDSSKMDAMKKQAGLSLLGSTSSTDADPDRTIATNQSGELYDPRQVSLLTNRLSDLEVSPDEMKAARDRVRSLSMVEALTPLASAQSAGNFYLGMMNPTADNSKYFGGLKESAMQPIADKQFQLKQALNRSANQYLLGINDAGSPETKSMQESKIRQLTGDLASSIRNRSLTGDLKKDADGNPILTEGEKRLQQMIAEVPNQTGAMIHAEAELNPYVAADIKGGGRADAQFFTNMANMGRAKQFTTGAEKNVAQTANTQQQTILGHDKAVIAASDEINNKGNMKNIRLLGGKYVKGQDFLDAADRSGKNVNVKQAKEMISDAASIVTGSNIASDFKQKEIDFTNTLKNSISDYERVYGITDDAPVDDATQAQLKELFTRAKSGLMKTAAGEASSLASGKGGIKFQASKDALNEAASNYTTDRWLNNMRVTPSEGSGKLSGAALTPQQVQKYFNDHGKQQGWKSVKDAADFLRSHGAKVQ